MFNNIIYFIAVLLIFGVSPSGGTPKDPATYYILMLFLTWLAFAVYCRWVFRSLLERHHAGNEPRVINRYQGLMFRLSILSIFLFTIDIFLFHLKYLLQGVPGLNQFSVIQGVLALILFFFYLGTIWYFSHPAYLVAFETDIGRLPFILSNIKLNLPIIFPWLILTFFYDLLSHIPLSGFEAFFNRPEGQFLFFMVFLTVLVIFLPYFIKTWWSCKPFSPSARIEELERFLHEKGLRYRQLLNWPIFEGRIMTAGIMGVVARYRYILVTEALMGVLTMEELKAVLAHEMGHAKYRHLLIYVFFIVACLVFWVGLFEQTFYKISEAFIIEKFPIPVSSYMIYTPLILLVIIIYFRYVMGFFMRQFERQADLYSARVMGSPRYTVSSLEKIALLSGKIRDLPSWHHFSIKERVDYLWRTIKDPGLFKKHNRFVIISFCIYLGCMIALGYLFNFSETKKNMMYAMYEEVLQQQIVKDPNQLPLYKELARIYDERGKYKMAMEAYEKIIGMDGEEPVALNNLAWLLLTIPDEHLREPKRALALAKKAVALDRSPVFLDTLAEAYYVNGNTPEALKAINEAIAVAHENRGYYQRQRKKFLGKN